MDHRNLGKLARLLEEKYWELIEGNTFRSRTARNRWSRKCKSLGIRKSDCTMEEPETIDQPHGQVFEEFVVVLDPCPDGRWLEMTRETAERILAIGIP